jgi:hypothetical protein
MLIQNATAEVHSARRRHQRELAARNRLRRLVADIDEIIEACEETHLQSIKECPSDLKERHRRLLAKASRIVARSGNARAAAAVEEQVSRHVHKVTEVMDTLWIVQDIVFDLMLPWRTELPEDVELSPLGVPVLPWRYDSAA